MRRNRFRRTTDWNGNIARMNKLIDEDMARRRARKYDACVRLGCQERAAGNLECRDLCVIADRTRPL